MIPARFQPLAKRRPSRASADASIRFLFDLWADYDRAAYTFIGTRRGDRWRDHPISGDREAATAVILDQHPADREDIYFCPNAFAEPRRKSEYALPSRYAWCDIDAADPDEYDPAPNILWETSPSRFQGIWIWRTASPAEIAERYSKNIWAKDGGDKGGWSITKMLRLVGTTNHKPDYAKPTVRLRAYSARPQKLPSSVASLETIKRPLPSRSTRAGRIDPAEVMQRYRRPMGLMAGSLMTAKRVLRADRSQTVFLICAAMIDAGASDEEIVTVLLVNPYFTAKWGEDVAQAEYQVACIRARVGAAR